MLKCFYPSRSLPEIFFDSTVNCKKKVIDNLYEVGIKWIMNANLRDDDELHKQNSSFIR
jgi:hypothetical protein